MGIALFSGSFDPITLGHVDILRRAAAVFDRVVVGVLVNAQKNGLFAPDERVELIRTVAKSENLPVDAVAFSGLTVDLAREVRAAAIVRGLRGGADFDAEQRMAAINRALGDVETVSFMASAQYAFISSSLVKEVGILGGDIAALLPASILDTVKERLNRG